MVMRLMHFEISRYQRYTWKELQLLGRQVLKSALTLENYQKGLGPLIHTET